MTIVDRIKTVIDENELSAAAFADKIGVQRSSISHILSGRNKPSLDFILKILHVFPTVESNWLLLGVSSKNVEQVTASSLFPSELTSHGMKSPVNDLHEKESTPTNVADAKNTDKEVERVTVFYSDGTCRTYNNKK